MGMLSELTSKVTGGSHGHHGHHGGASAGGPKEDYVDKGMPFARSDSKPSANLSA